MLKDYWRLWTWGIGSTGMVLGAIALPAQAETMEAYCNTSSFAIKVYNLDNELDPESPSRGDLYVRIYDRDDNLSFMNGVPVTAAESSYNDIEGTYYTNLRGANEWQLFVPTNLDEGLDPEAPGASDSRCAIFRDGDLLEFGQVPRL